MRKVLIGLALLLLLVLLGGFALPAELTLERSRTLPCSPESIYPHVVSLKKWPAWSPWQEIEPDTKNTYSGPDSGVGAKQSWEGQKTGKGSQEVTAAVTNREVKTKIFFVDFNAGAEAVLHLTPSGDGARTTARWTYRGDAVGNPLMRYMNSFMVKGMLSKQYDRGLELLQKVACAESGSKK